MTLFIVCMLWGISMYLHGRNTGEAKAMERYEKVRRIDSGDKPSSPGWHR